MPYNIYYLTRLPTAYVRDYVRDCVRSASPEGIHFLLTEYELRLLMLKILDSRGQLDMESQKILRTPLFGKAYVAEKGDVSKALERILVDVLPGSSLLRFI